MTKYVNGVAKDELSITYHSIGKDYYRNYLSESLPQHRIKFFYVFDDKIWGAVRIEVADEEFGWRPERWDFDGSPYEDEENELRVKV